MTTSFLARLGRRGVMTALAVTLGFGIAAPVRAQEVMSKDAAVAVRAAFLADLEVMRGKFVQLAEAFPQSAYSYRPMDGVRSVSEVLMLAASEGYAFVPTSFGGKAWGTPEERSALSKNTDKAATIDHINKGFAYAKAQLEAVDPATLTGTRQVMRQNRNVAEIAQMIGGDLHEHLGQLIAYARANRVVPPWSK